MSQKIWKLKKTSTNHIVYSMLRVHVFDLIAIISKKLCVFPFPIFSFKCSHILMPQIVTSLPSHPSHGLPTPIPKKFITHISPKGAPCLHSSCVLVYLYASPIPQVNSLAPGSRRISVWDPPWRISCLGWDPRYFEPKKMGVWRPAGSVLEKTMNQKDPLTRHGWAQEGWNWWCEFFCGKFAEHWCCWWQYPTKNIGNHGIIPDIY